jgi:thiamine biosynthesis lipoprotein
MAVSLAAGSRRVEEVWGTVIGVDVREPVAVGLLDDVFAWFDRVDDLFSTWRDDSEISRLGRRDLRPCDTSPEVQEVLALCDDLMWESRGAFDIGFAADPRVETREGFGPVDPSGFVKGWALERAATMLQGAGLTNFSINAGGDVLTRGRPEPGRPWRIGIQHPTQRAASAAVITGADLAVATSGRYERGDHIIDPRTGAPARGLISVTVVADDLGRADGYATAALVLGDAAMEWLATRSGIEAMVITDNDDVIRTNGFPMV